MGKGGGEEWMIYWLLYKSKAAAVILFEDAVMRFQLVFSARWCNFGLENIIQLLRVHVGFCVFVCVREILQSMFWFYLELKTAYFYFCAHGEDNIFFFSLCEVALCFSWLFQTLKYYNSVFFFFFLHDILYVLNKHAIVFMKEIFTYIQIFWGRIKVRLQ